MDGLTILVVVAFVLFGSTQIPKPARSLGSARTEFKQGIAAGGNTGTGRVEAACPVVVGATPSDVSERTG